jgi:RNA polymerase sigma factor (TIGR02999 family)
MSEPQRPSDITHILESLGKGDPQSAGALLPHVYDELRKLAQWKLGHEPSGQTLTATALVHEAYLRLVGRNPDQPWVGRSHFFAAAAESMRRILVENARRKRRLKHGGERSRDQIDPDQIAAPLPRDELLAVDEALDRLAQADAAAAEVVKLRYFAGLSIPQVADVLGISPRSADRRWAYARAWLRKDLGR